MVLKFNNYIETFTYILSTSMEQRRIRPPQSLDCVISVPFLPPNLDINEDQQKSVLLIRCSCYSHWAEVKDGVLN